MEAGSPKLKDLNTDGMSEYQIYKTYSDAIMSSIETHEKHSEGDRLFLTDLNDFFDVTHALVNIAGFTFKPKQDHNKFYFPLVRELDTHKMCQAILMCEVVLKFKIPECMKFMLCEYIVNQVASYEDKTPKLNNEQIAMLSEAQQRAAAELNK
jgi:hypothetical protein